MSFPNIGDEYYFASPVAAHPQTWEGDSTDIKIARNAGIFPHTREGRKLADWQHALIREARMAKFWEWVDDYVL